MSDKSRPSGPASGRPSERAGQREMRGTFHRVQVFTTMEAAHYGRVAAQTAAILTKRDAVAERAHAHYLRHKERWVEQTIARLTKVTPQATLSPPGTASSSRALIRQAAELEVLCRYGDRTTRIAQAAERMIAYVQGYQRSTERGR